jgi:MYXO-CTERM domain-containing protein
MLSISCRPARFGVAAAVLVAAPAFATNILVNPGFETGDLTGWPHSAFQGNISPSSAQVHDGGFSVKFSSVNAASLAMDQDVDPTPVGLISEVSLWYKRTGNPNASPAGIHLLYTDGTTTDATTDPAATNWTRLDLTPLLVSGKLLQSIQITASGVGQSVYFDDVTVSAVPAPGAGLLGLAALGAVARRRR